LQLAIYSDVEYNLAGTGGQLPEVVAGQKASWNLFPVLEVQPAVGRLFTAADDQPGAEATAVLTWGLWKRRYGGDPAIVGRTILLDARPFTVIGVLPAWFTWPELQTQVWTPLYHESSAALMQMVDAHDFDVLGRLRPGATIVQAHEELTAVQRAIRHEHPDGPVNDSVNLRPMLEAETLGVQTGLYALLGATACLLLIACLNVANLLVARSASRRKEAAIRTALGGSRGRLIREQLVESMMLCGAGGALGIGLGSLVIRALVAAGGDIPRVDAIHMDGMVAIFALVTIIGCGLIAGLIPALSSRDSRVLMALQESSRSHSGGRGKARLRQGLLALEVGLTVVLLIGAGLLLRSYREMRAVNLGCDPHNVLTMEIRLPKGSHQAAAQKVAFFEQLLGRVRALPGVQSAGMSNVLPGQGTMRDDVFVVPELPPMPQGEMRDAMTRFVDPGYFAALRIPVREGEALPDDDRLDRAQEVVVNEALVRRYFGGRDPIGKHIDATGALDGSLRIVGVAGDTREVATRDPSPTIYYPLYSGQQRSVVLAVRTAGRPEDEALAVQKAIAGLDATLPVASVMTMEELTGESTQEARFDATLLLAFAVLSLVLAMVGLFGVLSFMVAQRTTEIGVRIALGASRERIMRQMLRDGLRPAVWGLVLGLAVSVGVMRLIQSLLFGTTPLDLTVFVVVSVTLLLVAAAACALPAWRASRLDPMQALRAE
jgi:predicted permease